MKVIRIPDESLYKKVSVICALFFPSLSKSEILVLTELVKMADGGSVDIKDTSQDVIETLQMNVNSFSVAIHRLKEREVISKQGQLVRLPSVFHDLINQSGFKIVFKNPDPGVSG